MVDYREKISTFRFKKKKKIDVYLLKILCFLVLDLNSLFSHFKLLRFCLRERLERERETEGVLVVSAIIVSFLPPSSTVNAYTCLRIKYECLRFPLSFW